MMKRIAAFFAVFFMTAWVAVSAGSSSLPVSVPYLSVAGGKTDTDTFLAIFSTQADLYSGTRHARGTLLADTGGRLYAVTVRHLFDGTRVTEAGNAPVCRVVLANGMETDAVLTALSDTPDLAFVEIDVSRLSAEQLAGVAAADPLRMAAAAPGRGDSILAAPAADDFRVGTVAWPRLYVASAGSDMLCCYLNVEPGLSGSGVFDVNGVLAGVLSMGSDAGEMLAVPGDLVYRMYQTNVQKAR